MRTFIAIDITATQEICSLLTVFNKHLRGLDVKYTALNNFHITLAFLGETTDIQVNDISRDLRSVKLPSNTIELVLEDTGVFKNGHNPSVIWVGIKPNDLLTELHRSVNQITEMHGFITENRKFSPHLTLARVKRVYPEHNLDSLLSSQKKFFGKTMVTEFVFYQSQLTPQGPIYRPIQRFKL